MNKEIFRGKKKNFAGDKNCLSVIETDKQWKRKAHRIIPQTVRDSTQKVHWRTVYRRTLDGICVRTTADGAADATSAPSGRCPGQCLFLDLFSAVGTVTTLQHQNFVVVCVKHLENTRMLSTNLPDACHFCALLKPRSSQAWIQGLVKGAPTGGGGRGRPQLLTASAEMLSTRAGVWVSVAAHALPSPTDQPCFQMKKPATFVAPNWVGFFPGSRLLYLPCCRRSTW